MNRDTTYSGEMRAVSLRIGLKLHQTKSRLLVLCHTGRRIPDLRQIVLFGLAAFGAELTFTCSGVLLGYRAAEH